MHSWLLWLICIVRDICEKASRRGISTCLIFEHGCQRLAAIEPARLEVHREWDALIAEAGTEWVLYAADNGKLIVNNEQIIHTVLQPSRSAEEWADNGVSQSGILPGTEITDLNVGDNNLEGAYLANKAREGWCAQIWWQSSVTSHHIWRRPVVC